MNVAAIVLAAGKSERMGRNKLLLRLNDQTIIDHVLSAIDAAHLCEVIVVLGHKPEELHALLTSRANAARTTINVEYNRGMTTSFQTGLRELGRVDAAFLILGDQPLLEASLLDRMIQHLEAHPDSLIVSPIYKGKKGHPVLFRSALFNDILRLDESATIRDVIHRYTPKLLTVDAPAWTTIDMDTPEDYQLVCSLMKERQRL